MKFKLDKGQVYWLHLNTGERLIGLFVDRFNPNSYPRFIFSWAPGTPIPVSPARILQYEYIEIGGAQSRGILNEG